MKMAESLIGKRFESIVNTLISRGYVESYTDFASKVGFKSASSVSSIISGRANPTPELLNDMLNKYKVSANFLLLGLGDMFVTEPQKPTKSNWQDTADFAFTEDDVKAYRAGNSFEDIVSRYKRDLTNPPMAKEQVVAYRTIVNAHSTPDILINVLYRLDNLENK